MRRLTQPNLMPLKVDFIGIAGFIERVGNLGADDMSDSVKSHDEPLKKGLKTQL